MKLLCAVSFLSVFIIAGCKKEPVKTINTVSVTNGTKDSSNYLKGTLGGELVKFEGNAIAYNGYVDPDSAQNHGGSGSGHDADAYYQSGSKWVTFGNGITATNASIELRSLAVRVFVSPTHVSASNYFNLINPTTYPVATDDNPSSGAYVSIRDNSGVLWTTAGDQHQSTLTISSIGPNMVSYTVVSGTISCKMYDGQGNMKQLTGATFTAAVGI